MKGNPVIHIYGVGAMGCRLGYALTHRPQSAVDTSITLIGNWRTQIDTLNREGLSVRHLDGNIETVPLIAATYDTPLLPADIALVLVKSWQTAEMAAHLTGALKPSGITVSLQNGLGNREILEKHLGAARVTTGVTAAGANLGKPGRLHLGGDGRTFIGALPGAAQHLADLTRILCKGGMESTLTDAIRPLIWQKLIANAAINPLTALNNIPNGALLEDKNLRNLMRLLVIESVDVARSIGVQASVETSWRQVLDICSATAVNISSMLQDVRNGRRTEIDAINGAIVRLGEQQGIDTPVNKGIWQRVLLMASSGNDAKSIVKTEKITVSDDCNPGH